MSIRDITVSDGKYTFRILPAGEVEVLRHGSPWVVIEQGCNAVGALLCRVEELEDEVAKRGEATDATVNHGKALAKALDDAIEVIDGKRAVCDATIDSWRAMSRVSTGGYVWPLDPDGPRVVAAAVSAANRMFPDGQWPVTGIAAPGQTSVRMEEAFWSAVFVASVTGTPLIEADDARNVADGADAALAEWRKRFAAKEEK